MTATALPTTSKYLPHPTFLKPIETVDELLFYAQKNGTEQDVMSLQQLIRDSYDAHSEKPPRGHIAKLSRIALEDMTFSNAFRQVEKSPIAVILQSCELGIINFRKVHNELKCHQTDFSKINFAVKLLRNEIETIERQLTANDN